MPIHGVEEWAGVPVLVMAMIQGESLQCRLDRVGPMPLAEALRMTLGMAEALAAAHAAGLVHRDVKPANILLQSPTGMAKLTDFGLARAADDPRVTRTGIGAGTPAFMSPEQASGHAADARSDLFSLGSVLYAALSGRPPFPAETLIGTLRRIAEGRPDPIRQSCPDLPRHTETLVMDLLERDPARRPSSAKLVAERLRQCLAMLAEGSDPAPVRRRRRLATMLGVMILALGSLAFAGTVFKFSTPEGTLVVEIDDPEAKIAYDVDGREMTITGVGVQEIKLRPGEHKLRVTPGKGPMREELVTISRGGKTAVRVTLEPKVALVPPGDPKRCPAVSAGDMRQCASCHTFHLDTHEMGLKLPLGSQDMGRLWKKSGPDLDRLREASRRQIATNNLKQIMLAMHNYADATGKLPAAGVKLPGKPGVGLSWRVMILPYIEQKALYDLFKLDEPWDSEHNKKLIARMPKLFAKPHAEEELARAGKTRLRTFSLGQGLKISDITDGTSGTIAIVEAAEPIEWTRPEELDMSAKDLHALIQWGWGDGTFSILAVFDGSVRAVRAEISAQNLKARLTPNGGELPESDW